ncbi:hypothetical protein NDN11_03530 [Acinetobacter sp. C26M]|uniref:hypothetical protein n=1 Tax=unclassified Acinetobacter TaxID=196816 RepID=UPI0020369D07|nr:MULTISPECIES: hypothetical protein [unclassified Acinetobacter]USA47206.1 hypothetical protein NDN11_03530 [Acinetobacter sp. C26M]USA50687.1 hypothetical protein NDN12_03530 [Acinetobacter sp. C26G]
MKIKQLICLIPCILITNIAFANPSPKEFFNDYITLGENFDPALAGLYSDSAKIHTYRKYPHGLERSMELTGLQWKMLIAKVMPIAKASDDRSKFSNIKITPLTKKYKIKADRYSTKKCYTDKSYYMMIEPKENGDFEIIEEYMETQPNSNC